MEERSKTLAAVLLLFIIAVVQRDATASSFEVEMRPYDGSNLICSFGVLEERTSAGPITCERSANISGPTGVANVDILASAGRGWVRTLVNTQINAFGSFSLGYGGCADAKTVIDDIVITGPSGQGTVELVVNVAGSTSGADLRGGIAATFTVRIRTKTPGGSTRAG